MGKPCRSIVRWKSSRERKLLLAIHILHKVNAHGLHGNARKCVESRRTWHDTGAKEYNERRCVRFRHSHAQQRITLHQYLSNDISLASSFFCFFSFIFAFQITWRFTCITVCLSFAGLYTFHSASHSPLLTHENTERNHKKKKNENSLTIFVLLHFRCWMRMNTNELIAVTAAPLLPHTTHNNRPKHLWNKMRIWLNGDDIR